MAQSRFPVLGIRGGPHPPTIELSLDGKPITKTTGLDLRLTMQTDDVARATWVQIIEPDIEVVLGRQLFRVTINGLNLGVVTAKADTVWQAVADCAKQLEAAAREEAPASTS
jgi:hypothetical protein